ncbi:hypothetical protein C9374_012139 [Naegleria lovaniensis]|uniref:F-box domain-containing protein n=1 Tax=Naegleria lovaniensis TaxID=51637 RepID=A0AA88KBZ9_NAELO|nr:uncharacterized protein C9374_012139 [Naegleria lovaniensis]KAG2373400.1 hypothetical protein C9374_012139 [Naegleria lovaniensis]
MGLTLSSNSSVNSYTPSCFDDDLCVYIMSFLEFDTIKVCFFVSKQWNMMARKTPVSLMMRYNYHNGLEKRLELMSKCQHVNITSLDLGQNSIEKPSAIKNIVQSKIASRLKVLKLDYNYSLRDSALSLITTSTKLTNLQVLNVNHCNITDIGVEALAQSVIMSNLRELHLQGNDISEKGARALSTSKFMSKLQILHLGYFKMEITRIGSKGAHYLAHGNSKFTELYLSFCDIGDSGAIEIGKSPHMSNLTVLNLRSNNIGNEGAMALIGSDYLTTLTFLDLSGNRLEKSGAKLIALKLSNLTTLRVGSNEIQEEGAISIVTSPHMSNLTCLSMSYNSLGVNFAEKLASSPYLSKLKSLDLCGNQLGDEGTIIIASSGENLKNLTQLVHELSHNQSTTVILKKFGKQEISHRQSQQQQ